MTQAATTLTRAEGAQAHRAALKPVYRASSAEAAASALEAFETGEWGRKYPPIAQSWRRNWEAVIPFFAFPDEVRKIIYRLRMRSSP
jgi:putative transposase